MTTKSATKTLSTPRDERLRAVLYARVSKDKSRKKDDNKARDARSPREQIDLGEQTAERNGWKIVARLVDNDLSASDYATKDRPDYIKLKAMIASGSVDIVAAYASNRLQRNLGDYVVLRDLCRANGVLWHYNGRTYDFRNSTDRFTTTLDAAMDAKFSEDLSAAVTRAFDANREAGKVHGTRQYGYLRTYDGPRPTGQVPHPEEADDVRYIFQSIADGVTLRDIARTLNEAGKTIKNGSNWTGARVRQQVYNRPSYLGHRMHKGQVVKRDCWEPLVSEELYETVQGVLIGRNTGGRPTAVKHLLSGLLRCGVCGSACRVNPGSGAAGTYVCRGQRDNDFGADGTPRSCVSRQKAVVDHAVVQLILKRLSRDDALAAFSGDRAAEFERASRELKALRKDLDQAVREYGSGVVDAAAYNARRAFLEPQIDALDTAMSATRVELPQIVLALVKAHDKQAAWDELDVVQQRVVIDTFVSELLLLKAPVVDGVRRKGRVGISVTLHGDKPQVIE